MQSDGSELPHLRDFWRVATMATMATPPDPTSLKISLLECSLVAYHPLPPSPFFSLKFQLGVAMVAMVAMP